MSTDNIEGGIWASCGHKLADEDEGQHAITLDTGCDFEGVYHCAVYSHVCTPCFERMKADGVLATPEEAAAWITSGRSKCA